MNSNCKDKESLNLTKFIDLKNKFIHDIELMSYKELSFLENYYNKIIEMNIIKKK